MLRLSDGVSGMDRILNEDIRELVLDRCFKDEARQKLEWDDLDQEEKLEVPGVENLLIHVLCFL